MSAGPSRLGRLIASPAFWFAAALVLRLLYLLEQGGTSPLFYQPLLDEKEAVDSAMEILRRAPSAEPYFKAPGYSWLLAAVIGLTGEAWPWVIRALQHIAGAGVVAMAASLAGRLCPLASWRGIAIGVTGFLATVYAPIIRLENNISLDFWVVFFQSAMLYWLSLIPGSRTPWKPILTAGAFAAAAWLTRPTITLVLPFLAVWIVWMVYPSRKTLRAALRPALLFLLPTCIAVTGVMIRNDVVSGEARAMPWQGGYSLYHANRPGVHGRYYVQQQIVEDDHANPTRSLAISGYTATLSRQEQMEFSRDPQFSDVNSYWFERTRNVIFDDPLAWTKLMTRKLVYLFSDKEIFNYEDFDLQRSLSPILHYLPGRFGVAFSLAFASLASFGLFSVIRKKLHLLQWVYIISLGGGIALYYTSGRMRMPLAFPMLVLSGCGAAGFLYLPTSRKITAALLLAAGVTIAWGDWWGVRSESMAHVDLARMSNAAWYRGRYEQALDFALQAEQLDPGYPALPRLKGQALYNLGRLEEAEAAFQKSVRILNDETSRRNLEVVREELRKTGLEQ